jgi:hypothetical protein
VFIAEDNVTSFNNYLTKVTAPIEKLLGVSSLGTSTVRSMQTMGRNYNSSRSGI